MQRCVNLSEPLRVINSSFNGSLQFIFGCKLFGQCVLKRVDRSAIQRCSSCRKFEPGEGSIPLPEPEIVKSPEPELIANKGKCIYLGSETRTVDCQLCGEKNKKIPVFNCELYRDECTKKKWKANQQERLCLTCDSYQE